MRNLLNFLIRYSTWFVFIFYVVLGCILLFSSNRYQQSVWLTSANAATATIQGAGNSVTGYFNLRHVNEDLQLTNAALENEVLNLKEENKRLLAMLGDTVSVNGLPERFDYVMASVINNSTRHPRNYFTINKGSNDGVAAGMGVVDHNGVVGIVDVTGRHTSRVISLLNETQHFNVKLKNTNITGPLTWRGQDAKIAYIEELPRHAVFHVGDTVLTSGYSTTFPEGIMIGTVMGRVRGEDDNFFTLKVRLAPDFSNLGTVRVLKDVLKVELDTLMQVPIEK